MSDKSVIISFDPADSYDEEILNAYGNVFNVSANSVYVKPVLYIDGKKVSEAEYTEYPLGTSTKIGLTLSYAGNYNEKSRYIENNAISGSTYALTVDDSVISNRELWKVKSELNNRKYFVNENNIFNRDYLGTLLAFSGKYYFAQLDAMDILASEMADVADIRCLSEAITGYEVSRKTLYGMVTKLEYGSLFIDVDSDNHAVVSRDGDKNKEILYRYNIGSTGSMCEGLIWSEALNENREDTVSTISILGKAKEEGIDIITLRKEDSDSLSILDKLELDESEKNRVKSDLKSGYIITIPKENVRIGDWIGTGYISINPDTGIGTYKISGGLSGGVDPIKGTAATVMAAFACYAEYLAAVSLTNALISLSIPGPLGALLTVGGLVLLAAGLYVLQVMMIAYVDYIAYGGDDRFDLFVQWFTNSMYMSMAQLYYAIFLYIVDDIYNMLKGNQNNSGNSSGNNSGDEESNSQNENGGNNSGSSGNTNGNNGGPTPQGGGTSGFTEEEINNLKKQVISQGQQMKDEGMTNKQLGPAIAGAYDKKTGNIVISINDNTGAVPDELSPIIRERIDNMPQDVLESYIKTKGAGSHAEVYAVNQVLLQNPDADKSDILVYVNRTLGSSKPVVEAPFCTCPHCRYILEGFTIISDQ